MAKKIKKLLIPTTVMLGLIIVGLLSSSYISAQDSNYYPPIVQKIAEKFNLNVEDVQDVFDEERNDHHAEMQALWSERLDDLVNEGNITAEQKQAILDKHEELEDKMESLKDLNWDERQEKMKEIREEFKNWASSQNIVLPLLGPFGKGMGHHWEFGRMGMMH